VSLRIGTGLDVHAFSDDPRRPLVLAGVTIPEGPGLDGHSDADAAAHAVADALLGAAALGDLGSHAGVDLPETAGADSMRLLGSVVAELGAIGAGVVNLDLTIVAQRPRLAAHRDDMRRELARCTGLADGAVSVKFTTTDRLGSIGRGEGIACWASALVDVP